MCVTRVWFAPAALLPVLPPLLLRVCYSTKLGCGEGGCGACTVMVSTFDRDKKKIKHAAVNACLAPVVSYTRIY